MTHLIDPDPTTILREHLSAHADVNPPHGILDLYHPDTHICVGTWADAYSVWWTDYVANDWLEWYPTLSMALARTAGLLHCGEHDWNIGFTATSFPEAAALFFKEITQ